MDVVLTLTLPLFAVVGLGYLAARQGMLGDGAVRSLNAFVFYFALPALLVRTIARQEIADVFVPVYFVGYLVASLLMFAVGALIAKVLRGRRSVKWRFSPERRRSQHWLFGSAACSGGLLGNRRRPVHHGPYRRSPGHVSVGHRAA